jgi:type I site-specific restriction endonuclease
VLEYRNQRLAVIEANAECEKVSEGMDQAKQHADKLSIRHTYSTNGHGIRSMACRWPDQDIAASLNRMDTRAGRGMTWNAHRVSSLRREHGIHAHRSAEKNGELLTMSDAAKLLCVANHAIRRLIKERPRLFAPSRCFNLAG